MRLRSPRSFRSTGFSHTDRCIVGLKKKTLSSPVHTTHLDRREQMSRRQQSDSVLLTDGFEIPTEARMTKISRRESEATQTRLWVTQKSSERLRSVCLVWTVACFHLTRRFSFPDSSRRSGDFKQIKFTITPTSSIDYHAFKVLVINQKVTQNVCPGYYGVAFIISDPFRA